MAKHYKITRVYNEAAYELPVGFLGANGALLGVAGSNTGYFDHHGDLIDDLKPDEVEALNSMVSGGTLSVEVIEGTTEVDTIYNEQEVVFKKAFGTGTGSTTIYSAASPTKLELIDMWVNITTPATRSAKDVTSGTVNFQLRDGAVAAAAATGVSEVLDIGTTAAPTGGTLVRLSRFHGYAATNPLALARGGSLIIAVTGTHAHCLTGLPAGVCYVRALKVV